MHYLILVNRDNLLDKNYVPNNLVQCKSKYRDGMRVCDEAYKNFVLMKAEALKHGYSIDIMSGYRDYDYQERIYKKLVLEKGFNYAFRYIAPPGASEHQTGLAIDVCVYRDNKCYTEHEIENFPEIKWLHANMHMFGFILRYPLEKENITGYNYEPWHLRYVGDIANYLYTNDLTLEQYLKKTCQL